MAIVRTKLFRTWNLLVVLKAGTNHPTRRYGSALFISGRRASETFAILSPVLDFDDRFANLSKLETELRLRGLNPDLKGMKKAWDYYKEVESNRTALEQQRSKLANQIKALSRIRVQTPAEEVETGRLKTLAKAVKRDLKVVKAALWEIEDSVVAHALKLPNVLHPNTPSTRPKIIYSSGSEPVADVTRKTRSHVEIGARLGILEYSSPSNYYLCGDAAAFELAVIGSASQVFTGAAMLRVTGLDFSRSIIVEASGLDHENPDDSFILRDNEEVERHSSNRVHLVGGASLHSFLSMHAKQLINPNHFPLRYFAGGRQYVPFPVGSREAGLFTVCQSTAVQVFAAVKDSQHRFYFKEFERIIGDVKNLYDGLCNHYRIVLRPARELEPWESLRASVELWSSNLSEYIEVGHVSLCGEYLSKRLLIGCQTPSGRTFPSVISGTVLSVPKLLGCLIEETDGSFVVPEKLREHMPV